MCVCVNKHLIHELRRGNNCYIRIKSVGIILGLRRDDNVCVSIKSVAC